MVDEKRDYDESFRGYPGIGAQGGRSLSDLIEVLWRRKIWMIVTAGIFGLGGFMWSLQKPPIFRAEARVLLEDGPPTAGLFSEFPLMATAPPAAAEIEVVKSFKIANRVAASFDEDELGLGLTMRVDDLDRHGVWSNISRRFTSNLAQGSLFAKLNYLNGKGGAAVVHFTGPDRCNIYRGGLGSSVMESFTLNGESIKLGNVSFDLLPDGDLTGRKFKLFWSTPRGAAEYVLSRLSAAETSRGSGVLRISFADSDPDRAANITNKIVQSYIDRSRERKAARAKQTVVYIGEQLVRVQGELDEAEKELVYFQEKEGAALLSEAARAIVERMSALDLEQAKLAMLIESQSQLVKLMEEGVPIEEVGAGAELNPQTAAVLQELAILVAHASSLADEHTEEWPPLIRSRAKIAQLRKNIMGAARGHEGALKGKNTSLVNALNRWKRQLSALPRAERELARFQRKAQSFEQIYTYLLREEQEARIAQNGAVAAVSVVDLAVSPRSRSAPDLTLNVIVMLAFGLFFGVCFVFWRESTQKTILSSAQMEAATSLPQWGVIPDFHKGPTRIKAAKGAKHFLALRDASDSAAAEAYRSLRANLRFAAKGRKIKTLTITSAAQGEGKSTTIADLAIALANGGSTALLVDADLRRPVINSMFHCRQSPGLADIIKDREPWAETIVRETGIENLHVIPSGIVNGTNPGDLLALSRVTELLDELKEAYDYVLFDVPPVLAVADATSFLEHIDGILFLARYNYVPEAAIAAANQRLLLSGARPIGSILNGMRIFRVGYGYEYQPTEINT